MMQVFQKLSLLSGFRLYTLHLSSVKNKADIIIIKLLMLDDYINIDGSMLKPRTSEIGDFKMLISKLHKNYFINK